MGEKIGNIKVKGIKKDSPRLECNEADYIISLYKDDSIYNDFSEYNKFIKGCEKLIRISNEYKSYKDHLMNVVGLNYCQVFPQIHSDLVSIGTNKKPVTIEMHHGPILTLYDYCTIVVDHLIANGEPVTTFKIANIIIKEHQEFNIETVMVCDLVHKLIHDNKIFVNRKQAWGHADEFLKRYKDGVDKRKEKIILNNIELSKHKNSVDIDDVLELYCIKKWK